MTTDTLCLAAYGAAERMRAAAQHDDAAGVAVYLVAVAEFRAVEALLGTCETCGYEHPSCDCSDGDVEVVS